MSVDALFGRRKRKDARASATPYRDGFRQEFLRGLVAGGSRGLSTEIGTQVALLDHKAPDPLNVGRQALLTGLRDAMSNSLRRGAYEKGKLQSQTEDPRTPSLVPTVLAGAVDAGIPALQLASLLHPKLRPVFKPPAFAPMAAVDLIHALGRTYSVSKAEQRGYEDAERRREARMGKFSADTTKVFGGTTFRIDRPKGFVKTWEQPDGSVKRYTYPVDYGYFPKLVGEDGEGLDTFVGDTPDGHYESFVKLKPGAHPGSLPVADETKFLIGLTDEERTKVYRLYKPEEISERMTYADLAAVLRHAETFPGKKRFEKQATAQNPAVRVDATGVTPPAEERHTARAEFAREAGKIAALQKLGLNPYALVSPEHNRLPENGSIDGRLEDAFRANDRKADPTGQEATPIVPFEDKSAEDNGVAGYAPPVKAKPRPIDTRTGIDLAFTGNATFDASSPMTMPGTINRAS